MDYNFSVEVKKNDTDLYHPLQIYLTKINTTLKSYFLISEVSTYSFQPVVRTLLLLIEEALIRINDTTISDALLIIVSHMRALHHLLRLERGKSLFFNEIIAEIKDFIQQGYLILQSSTFKTDDPSFIANDRELSQSNFFNSDEKDYAQEWQKITDVERSLYAAQKCLNSLPRFKAFLHDIWAYAIASKRPSKQVFISYAWPKEDDPEEAWTKPFVKKLAKHLMFAGIQVFLDENDSGPGNSLNTFMQECVKKANPIIVISSRTWAYKLALPVSGVKHEYKLICDNPHADVICILLNEVDYCQDKFKEPIKIACGQQGYLNGLRNLLHTIYGDDLLEFKHIWQEKQVQYSIFKETWQLPARNTLFVARENALSELKRQFLTREQCITVSCIGNIGSGKTTLALEYVYRCGAAYEAVYWFHADSIARLTKEYKQFGYAMHLFPIHHTSTSEEKAQLVKTWLENHPGWLLIFDAVTDYGSIASLIPTSGGHILLTSSEGAVSREITYCLTLVSFTSDETFNYLEKVLNQSDIIQARSIINALIKEPVLNIPRNLIYFCGYFQRNGITVAEAYDIYKRVPDLVVQYCLLPQFHLGEEQESSPLTLNRVIQEEKLLHNHFSSNDKNTLTLKDYFKEVASMVQTWLSYISFQKNEMLLQISGDLLSALTMLNYNYLYLKFIISHLKAIQHLIIFTKVAGAQLILADSKLIMDEGERLSEKIFQEEQTRCEESIIPSEAPCIVQPKEDNEILEKTRALEQNAFDDNPRNSDSNIVKQTGIFLLQSWHYALQHGFPSKKVFISFAPIEEDIDANEPWLNMFVAKLAKHLMYAGIQVYGHTVGQPECLANIFGELNHILVISSRSLDKQIKSRQNQIFEEFSWLTEQVKQKPYLISQRFIVPILVNNKNYCNSFQDIAELSFFKMPYTKALKNLLITLYGFDRLRFTTYWREQLICHQMLDNLWHVPSANAHFTGRIDLLQSMKKHFSNYASGSLMLTAHGIGGVGKTTTAVQFIHQECHHFHYVFWFNAHTPEQLMGDYLALGEEKKLFTQDDIRRNPVACRIKVKEWLQNCGRGDWLLIYDDVSAYEDINEFLPIQNCKIIITSRHEQWPLHEKFQTLVVLPFTNIEARAYIQAILGEQQVEDESEIVDLLIEHVGGLPLALAHACAFIQIHGLTIEAYIGLYGEQYARLFEESLPIDENIKAITLTWNVTLSRLPKEVYELLYCCAFLSPNTIPELLVQKLLESIGKLPDEIHLRDKVLNSKRIAAEYSLITRNGPLISLHPVLQQVMRYQLERESKELAENHLIKCIQALIATSPSNSLFDIGVSLHKILLPHLRIILIYLENYLKSDPSSLPLTFKSEVTFQEELFPLHTRVLEILGSAYRAMAEPQKAFPYYEKQLDLLVTRYGNDHLEVAKSKHRLAQLHGLLHNFLEKKRLLKEAIITKEQLSASPQDIAITLIGLGTVYGELNKPEKSIKMFELARQRDDDYQNRLDKR